MGFFADAKPLAPPLFLSGGSTQDWHMTIRTKLIVASIVLVGAVAYLAAAGMKSGWVYYLEVDRFVSDTQYRTQRVRLHGKVDEADFAVKPGSLTANFKLLGHTQKLPVVYH